MPLYVFVPDCQTIEIVKAVIKQPRNGENNITDFVQSKSAARLTRSAKPGRTTTGLPCLSRFITSYSWIIFDYLNHDDSHIKWLNYPLADWPCDQDYKRFQSFINKLAVVNDPSERAVKQILSVDIRYDIWY